MKKEKPEKKLSVQPMMTSNYQATEVENKKQSWKPFLNLVKNVKFPWLMIAGVTVLMLVQSTLVLLFPQYTVEIYSGNFSSSLAVTATFVILGQALLLAVIDFIGGYVSAINKMRLQNYVWRRISRLPMSFFSENEPRDLISRTTDDTASLGNFVTGFVGYVLKSIYSFIGSFVLIFNYNWKLAASMAICLPLCYLLSIVAGRIYFKLDNRIQSRLSDMTRYFSAILPYVTLTKLFGRENQEEQNGYWWIDRHFETSMKNAVAELAVTFADTFVTVLQELVIILMGVWLIQTGEIDVSIWIAFYIYANTMNSNFNTLMSQWESIKRNQGASARISAVTNQEPEENNGTLDAHEAHGDLSFNDVSFAYRDNSVVSGISFTAHDKQLTAIVGPSGAGKTTLLKLTERLYQPDNGSISLADTDVKDYELHSWRRNIGYIPQDPQLFSGTIRDNITYGVKGEVSEADIRSAAERANALEFIEGFENGFDTEVGENGARLSGGQRQRIAIARTLLMNAQIFILDEATSSLDSDAESEIHETIEELRKDHMVIMVAHRMDSVKDADQIVVMEKGQVLSTGNHDTLMKSCPLYRDMVSLQHAGIAI